MAQPDSKGGGDAIEPVTTTRIPHWRLVFDQAGITPEVANFKYPGSGTEDDPYKVQWIPGDPRNPMLFPPVKRWFITIVVSIATLAVALVSSAYTGGIREIILEFGIGQEVATLGVSLFVVGFAVGPLLWAPFSELFGRQVLFIGTYAALTAFNAGCAGAQNSWTLLILRFFAGAFGSSPLTNAGGVIADMFPASERGLAMAVFAAAPFLGPVLGPVAGGFLGMNAGWRWVMGLLAAFSGTLWIAGSLLVPETYPPVLLRKRAAKLSKMTGKHYVSKLDHDRGKVSLGDSLKIALSRPWVLLLKEPIVLLLSIYMAIIYGTLYMLFAAFPIVYQQNRGWNQGIGGLAFLGIMVGMLFAIAYTIPSNNHYVRVQQKHNGYAPPETRLLSTMVGCVALPIGLFWFAWTNYPSIHFMASIAAGVPFGFGMVLVFLSIMNYLIDSYTIFAASVLAANSVLRSIFGAVFPLFTSYMYADLGIHWASSIPAFLALACVPFPFLFYKYGPGIRSRCKFAAESAAFMEKLQQDQLGQEQESDPEKEESREVQPEDNVVDDDHSSTAVDEPTYAPIAPAHSRTSIGAHSRASVGSQRRLSYEGNPYDIDRVNTKQSFT
ncbi:MFS general substrate transporter [Thozetella sp. PMI_491]|nr:MFS general substrate transporter [Thozetella sp. PMI_491]